MTAIATCARGVVAVGLTAALGLLPASIVAQEGVEGATVLGRVLDASDGTPLGGVAVRVEGTYLAALTDSLGRYRLTDVPPGPQVLRANRIGFATARVPITVPGAGTVRREIRLAETAVEMDEITVTADAVSRAEGELGTATVIDREAIETQTATSLADVLEQVPGVPIQPPGLGGSRQVALRAVPVPQVLAGFAGLGAGVSATDLASFGTTVIQDGVPVSNNANLQSLGPRAEFFLPGTAGEGIDLRQIPASTLERVEVIRGIASPRYGDLTQGAVVVYTRAGEVAPDLTVQADARTLQSSFTGGEGFAGEHAGTLNLDVARTLLDPGRFDDVGSRISGQLSHRYTSSGSVGAEGRERARFRLDSRLNFFQLLEDHPLEPEVNPGRASRNRDRGIRLTERARLAFRGGGSLSLTAALDYAQQRSFIQGFRTRPALPFTDRLTEGRQEGFYVIGDYLSRVDVDGNPGQLFLRLEGERPAGLWGFRHLLLGGLTLRREWNSGPGLQFDIETPPQTTFNGVQGFDRPRSFDAVPGLALSSAYADDRLTRVLGDVRLSLQAGLRLDLLHEGEWWGSGVRDASLQPRVNAELAPVPDIRLRAGWGRLAKVPTLGQLYPAPQYYDFVNVNFFPQDHPEEQLAVLTTHIRDPTNPDLGFIEAERLEAGIEVALGPGTAVSLVAFDDHLTGGVATGFGRGFLTRERFALSDSTVGDGRPPEVVTPAAAVDTVPILVHRPENNLTLDSRGLELTAFLPEIRPLRTELQVQGAWAESELSKEGIDLGGADRWSEFQLDADQPRTPFWDTPRGTGERLLLTYRAVHHQPELGLVVTAEVQHFAHDVQEQTAGSDTLAFAGYVTRTGDLVRVPPAERSQPEFRDLRIPRSGLLVPQGETAPDWLLNVRATKALPLDGRLSFYAFNLLNREGTRGGDGQRSRFFPSLRFGLELAVPLQRIFGGDGSGG